MIPPPSLSCVLERYGEIHTYYFKINILSTLVNIKLKNIINDKIYRKIFEEFLQLSFRKTVRDFFVSGLDFARGQTLTNRTKPGLSFQV